MRFRSCERPARWERRVSVRASIAHRRASEMPASSTFLDLQQMLQEAQHSRPRPTETCEILWNTQMSRQVVWMFCTSNMPMGRTMRTLIHRSHWMLDRNRLACSEARECECCKMPSTASNIGPEYEAGSLITSAKIVIYRSS